MRTPRLTRPAEEPTPVVRDLDDQRRGAMFWLFIAMAFLYPVWPVFIERKIGPLPSFTPQKFLTYLLFGLSLLQFAFHRPFSDRVSRRITVNADLWILIAAILALKVLSGTFSASPFYCYGLLYYETLITVGILFIALGVVTKQQDLRWLFAAMLLSSVVIVAYSIAETIAGKNLLEPFIPVEKGLLALIDKQREGSRRIQGPFASPLLLAEYSVMMLPLILTYFGGHRGTTGKVALIALIAATLVATYMTRTRSALGAAAIASLIWAFVLLRRYLRKPDGNTIVKYIVAFYGGIAILVGIAGLIWLLWSLLEGHSIAQVLGIAESSGSIYRGRREARFTQLEMALPKLAEQPLLGFGTGIGGYMVGFVGTDAMLTLDSHLLSLAADNGLPAMLLTVWFMGLAVHRAWQLGKQLDGEQSRWAHAIALSLGCIAFFMIISPLVDLFPLAFLLVGALMVMRTETPAPCARGIAT